MREFAPLDVLSREPVRRLVIRKLLRLGVEKGFDKIGHALILTGDSEVVRALQQRPVVTKSLSLVLQVHGVTLIYEGNRKYRVTDAAGSFSFVDDYYGSGVEHLFGDVIRDARAERPEDLPLDLVPNSIRAELLGAGLPVTPIGARTYLAGLHATGAYPSTLKFRLQGGSFEELRKTELNEFVPEIARDEELAVQQPRLYLRNLMKGMSESTRVDEFTRLAALGLAMVRQSGMYQEVLGYSSKSSARALYDVTSREPIADAFLLGKAKKKGNIEIFSALCRRVAVLA